MKKYSQTTLARAYVSLMETYSSNVLAKGFAELLMQQHATRDVASFGEEVARVLADKNDSVLATVKSARELSQAAKKRISAYITSKEQRKRATISYVIDPALIGGALIETAMHTYNLSVQDKINSIL